MRFVLARPWRAFPELDGIPDEECRRILSDIKRRHRKRLTGALVCAAAYLCVGVPFWMSVVTHAFPSSAASMPAGIIVAMLLASLVPVVLPAQLIHDSVLQQLIRDEIHRACCRRCGYSLVGLPIADGRTRCPECGSVHEPLT